MSDLYDRMREFDDDGYRNIVALRKTEDLFDDLADGDPILSALLAAAEMRVKRDLPRGGIERGFHYSTAIGYPFHTEPFMASRFGDGRYGVWYSSLEMDTSIHETVWHMIQDESGIEGLNEVVIRERVIYRVHCSALLIDLSDKAAQFPPLTSEDYSFTQQVGGRIQREGHPGLLAPSARRAEGNNMAIFNPAVLSDPQVLCYLTYRYDPVQQRVRVEREPGRRYLELTPDMLRPPFDR